eukprot:6669462-Heterocapsa_arctica.AAC.1
MSAYHLKFLSLRRKLARHENRLGVHVGDHPGQEEPKKPLPICSWISVRGGGWAAAAGRRPRLQCPIRRPSCPDLLGVRAAVVERSVAASAEPASLSLPLAGSQL